MRGKEMGQRDGVLGAPELDNNIKLIWAVASNILINQHGNINCTRHCSSSYLFYPEFISF
jgi:anaerobic dimethyl sulfoxide reductase subunit A